ncbi:centrosomal protein of 192 kDa-like [Mobula hypostoma]|uniref:centrosomal protein of 192 kDa-like n=1 Tax=Mobula hypostoma TaxID=723540 RepID=UPI002FC2D773
MERDDFCFRAIYKQLKTPNHHRAHYRTKISPLTDPNDTEDLDSFSSSLGMSLCSESVLGTSERDPANSTLDFRAMSELQSFPLFLHTSNKVQNQLLKPKSWTVRPKHLILTIPSVDGFAERMQIINHSTRSLSFELSWPAHSLTVTPQHGVLDPESHMLILVCLKPLIAKTSVSRTGHLYVHCDNTEELIKVEIQGAMIDNCATVQSPEAAVCMEPWTPYRHTAKIQLKSTPTKLKIKNQTINFPSISPGSSSESLLEIENDSEETVQWFLSFESPYVKWLDWKGDTYRAFYQVFKCSSLFGILQGHSKEELPLTFMPRGRGKYVQLWDLEYRLSAQPHIKYTIQFQLHGVGTIPKMCSKRMDSSMGLVTCQEKASYNCVFAAEDFYLFPATPVGETSMLKVNLRNSSSVVHKLKFITPKEPFYVKYSYYTLRSQHYINLPVQFKPESEGIFEELLIIQTDICGRLTIKLTGEAIKKGKKT